MKIEDYQDKIVELCKENAVKAAYLFGSYAQNTVSLLSDIDIAVLLSSENKQVYAAKRLFFINELMQIFHKNNVDVVLLNEAPVALRFNVIKDGRLLYVNNEEERINFESQTIIEYIETQPLRDVYNNYLFKNIKKGSI